MEPLIKELDSDELDILIEESKQKALDMVNYREAYRQKILEAPKPFVPASFEAMGAAFKMSYKNLTGKDWQFTEYNTSVIEQIVAYFSGDADRFNGDLSKGIYLVGPVGAGKTSVIKAFQMFGRIGFGVIETRQIEALYDANGYEGISKYSKRAVDSLNRPNGWLFDDLGTERDGRNYGKQVNVMETLFSEIYSSQIWNTIFVTTNLSVDAVRERYGDRVVSRFAEMFNMISYDIKAPDMRKK